MRRRGWVFGVAVAAAAAAACTASSEGSPAPERSLVAPSSAAQEQLSPPVQNPRDIRVFGDRPCEVLTPEQIIGFGFDQSGEQRMLRSTGSQVCDWTDSGSNGNLSVIIHSGWDILEREYANRATYPVFEPIEIAGMPAIERQNNVGSTRCVVVVGLAERQGINIEFTDLTDPIEDPCGAARMAAEVAVGNLPPLG